MYDLRAWAHQHTKTNLEVVANTDMRLLSTVSQQAMNFQRHMRCGTCEVHWVQCLSKHASNRKHKSKQDQARVCKQPRFYITLEIHKQMTHCLTRLRHLAGKNTGQSSTLQPHVLAVRCSDTRTTDTAKFGPPAEQTIFMSVKAHSSARPKN